MRHSSAIVTLIVLAVGSVTGPARAWGPVGHETVAYIAEDNLTPAAREKVEAILGADVSLADVANWADQIKPNRPETAGWHFIDIKDRTPGTESDEPRYCTGNNCVVDQITLDLAALKNKSTSRTQELEALKFLVHFVGDLHQPLHCADDNDRGGNGKTVLFVKPGTHSKGTKLKLHAVWDHLIEVKTAEDPQELASELEQHVSDAEKVLWVKGSRADWAWESFTIAHDTVYAEFSAGPTDPSGVPLPKDYYSGKMRKIVDLQLEKAGLRLAHILNDMFGAP